MATRGKKLNTQAVIRRTGAVPDRHFIGLIDEVRISDEANQTNSYSTSIRKAN
jgi:hypothetical protein